LPLTVVVHGEPRGLIPMANTEQERSADPEWIAAQRAFAARSNRSRFVIAARSGHLVVDERPDLVIAEVKAMLAELRRSP
jgi:pimeloyl-ACP methyl ester carboxylesterase